MTTNNQNEPSQAIRQMQKKYNSTALLMAVAIGSVFIFLGYIAIGKGLILGTLFSIINFSLMGLTLPARIGKTRNKAMIMALGSLILRFAILAIPFAAAIKMNDFNLISTIAGVFMIHVVIMLDNVAIPVIRTFYRNKSAGAC